MNNPDNRPTIHIVDADTTATKRLANLLNANGYVTTVFSSAEYFLRTYDPARNAVLIVELDLPGMGGADLQTHLIGNGLTLPTIAVAKDADVPTAVAVMRAGAVDFVEKPLRETAIIAAVRLAAGMLFERQKAHVSKQVVAARLAKLTEREREVLKHLLLGKLNKEIGNELSVSQRTIEGHRARIREKMHARGIADLIRMIG